MADDVMQRVREGSGPDRELAREIARVLRKPDEPDDDLIWVGKRLCQASALLDEYLGPGLWLALARERDVSLIIESMTVFGLGYHAKAYRRGTNLNGLPDASAMHNDPARACALAMLEALSHG